MEANILGRGIDNHLLGLREAARETLGELPPIFTDDTYKKMIEYKLSTSQVYSISCCCNNQRTIYWYHNYYMFKMT